MRRFFGRKENGKIILEDSEFFHLNKVLRMKVGEDVIASINDENDYYCKIARLSKNSCELEIERVEKCRALPKNNLVLFQMMPKKEYFDNILPKAIELGVSEIYFFTSSRVMIKDFKRERVDSQVLTACKQCERSRLPIVHNMITFEQMLEKLKNYDCVIFPNEHEKNQTFDTGFVEGKKNIAVVVGNEGGFSEEEAEKIIDHGGKSFTLGSRILRCDTAVVATLTLVDIFSNN